MRGYTHDEEDEFAKYDLTDQIGDSDLSTKKTFMQNFIDFIKDIVSWIMWSSVNEEKISLTLRGFIPFLVFLGISDISTLNQLVGTFGQLIISTAQGVSLIIAIVGFARKLLVSSNN